MNLRVELILPSEQRSASPIRLKFLARVMSFAAAAGLMLFATINLLAIGGARGRLRIAEARWHDVLPHRERAINLIRQTTEHLEMLTEVDGWQHSRLALNNQLLQLSRLIPGDMYLQNLELQHEFQVVGSNSIGRLYSMTLAGGSPARGAERNVQNLKRQIAEDAMFAPLLETVNVPVFQEDAHDRNIRVFQIVARYRTRSFSP